MTQLSFFSANPAPLPDVCANKHKGHRNSVAANQAVDARKASVRERVRLFVAGCAERGTTIHEIAHFLNKPVHSVSGRISEAKALGQIFDSGRDREGCSVLVADRRWVNGSAQR